MIFINNSKIFFAMDYGVNSQLIVCFNDNFFDICPDLHRSIVFFENARQLMLNLKAVFLVGGHRVELL